MSDRRISRSKQAMRSAFLELTDERGIDGFTVNDLCERADVNRGTFYNHFKDKEEMLAFMQDDFMEGLAAFRNEISHFTLRDLAKFRVKKEPIPQIVKLFDYLREQGSFLCVMLGSGGDIGFKQMLQDTICTELIYSMLHDKYKKNKTAFVNYYVSFYSAAYMGVITTWLQTGMKETSEDMARIAMRLLFIKPGESIKI